MNTPTLYYKKWSTKGSYALLDGRDFLATNDYEAGS
jgi:hypothetical protein